VRLIDHCAPECTQVGSMLKDFGVQLVLDGATVVMASSDGH